MRWVVVVGLAGCFAPVPPEGAPCGEPPARACPTGQRCGPDDRCTAAPPTDDASRDSAPATCSPRRLLVGGQSALAQGWTIDGSGNRSIEEANGVTTLMTTSGHQLLVLADALPISVPWGLQVEMRVLQSGGHATNAAALAVMASYRAPLGDDDDRRRLLWIENASVGWGDNTTTVGVQMQQPATVRIEPTASGGIRATITVAGSSAALTTGTFTTNGTIAIGDQSTVAGLDSSFQISAIDLYCP